MSTKKEKIQHIKSSKQDRFHMCHWPGCKEQVTPAKWGCFQHWMKLPDHLRNKIWSAYRIGQEKNLTPSRHYVKVAREVQEWIKNEIRSGASVRNSNRTGRRV